MTASSDNSERLARGQKELDRAQHKVNTATAALDGLKSRRAATEIDRAAAADQVNRTGASLGAADAEPATFHAATRRLAELEAELKALDNHALPAADIALSEAIAERAAAKEDFARLHDRALVVNFVLPADRDFAMKLAAASEALAACLEARKAVLEGAIDARIFRDEGGRGQILNENVLVRALPFNIYRMAIQANGAFVGTNGSPPIAQPDPTEWLRSALGIDPEGRLL
jgi:small-conductance mechanosensitive channel